ncbi:MAG TPA: SH3 domain-containing protein [Clostridiales bacterium]|nr:SH3 domain-containing protein [Clostridiales bacterium]
MWTCTQCGQENDGKFCIKCGKPFEEPSEATPEEASLAKATDSLGQIPISLSAPEPKKKSKTPLLIGIIAGSVLLLAVIITIIAVVLHKGNDNAVPESTGVYYYVSGVDDYAVLYEQADANSRALARLGNGDPVEYLYDENSKFVYVLDHGSGLYGYMLSDNLVASLEDVDDGDEDEAVEDLDSLGDYYVTKTKTSLSLRSEANSDSAVVAELYNGDMVALLERTTNKFWYVYDYSSGNSGYVLKAYLTDDYDDVKYDESEATTVIGTYYVVGTKNYLAIRSNPSSSADVIIGKTYNGYEVGLIERTNDTFWYIYDYNSGLYGYVKCAYLTDYYDNDNTYYGDYYVSGTTNYLAIRSEPSPSSEVEIGRTYNGSQVLVIEKTNNTFWYVYDYSSALYGYVKCAYLIAE